MSGVQGPLPFLPNVADALRRYGVRSYGTIAALSKLAVPVVQLGSQLRSNENLPLFGIGATTTPVGIEFSSVSLTGSVDLEIEACTVTTRTFVFGGSPAYAVFVPPATYVPFAGATVLWTPGLVPRLDLSKGRAQAVSGNNVATVATATTLTPPVYQCPPDAGRSAGTEALRTYELPLRGLQLPARTFLTVQCLTAPVFFGVDFYYRELP